MECPSSLYVPFKYWNMLVTSPKPSFLKAEQARISQLFFTLQLLSPLIIFAALLWTLSSLATSFLFSGHQNCIQIFQVWLGQPWVECNDNSCVVDHVLVGAIQHPTVSLCHSSTQLIFTELNPPGSPGPFPQSCFPATKISDSWIMFSHIQDLVLVFAEPAKALISPLFQPIQNFLQGGSPFFRLTSPLSLTPSAKFTRAHQVPPSRSLMMVLNSGPIPVPGDPTCDRQPVWEGAFPTLLWVLPISQFPASTQIPCLNITCWFL